MTQPFRTDHWQAQLPEDWEVLENAPGVVTLYSPTGPGMLQIVFSDSVYDGVGLGQNFRGRLVGKYYAGSVHRGTFRRSWCLSCSGRTLWVSYSCAEKCAKVEIKQIDKILQSLDEVDTTLA